MSRSATFFLVVCAVAFLLRGPVAVAGGAGQVYWTHDGQSLVSASARPTVVRQMVNDLIRAVAGTASADAGWRGLFNPGDRVGIKVSAEGGAGLSTHPEVVLAVLDGLESAGVVRRDVIVWDRRMDALSAGGLTATRLGCQVLSTETTYDAEAVFSSPFAGRLIWGDRDFRPRPGAIEADDSGELSSKSYFTDILSKRVDKVIVIPVLSDHFQAGLAGALYQASLPNLDNWRRFTAAPRFGNPAIPEILRSKTIEGKPVLFLVDALLAQYAGGPDYQPNYAFEHRTLYASTDPVALDVVLLDQIEAWRASVNLPSIRKQAPYLMTAQALGLGVADPRKITLVEAKPQTRPASPR